MKIRDSDMPEEDFWSAFFDSEAELRALGLGRDVRNVAEFGCGYGTFTLPATRLSQGTVHAFDIAEDDRADAGEMPAEGDNQCAA